MSLFFRCAALTLPKAFGQHYHHIKLRNCCPKFLGRVNRYKKLQKVHEA